MVVDIDLGFRKITKEILSLRNVQIQTGFQEGTVTQMAVKNGEVKQPGQSMAQIAAQNEFGTSKIPMRSFMRTAWDENQSFINNLIETQVGAIVDQKEKPKRAFDIIGNSLVALIQRKIYQITTPPNDPYTIAKKGSSKPLIDFGQMVQSVRYVVK